MSMPEIDRRRRFIFRGNAAAIGGRIVRPTDVVLESHVSSSLTVAGGRSTASGTKINFDPYVFVDSAATSAEGQYDDLDQHIALTHRQVTADALTTSTRVWAEVHGLRAGLKPVLTVKALRGSLTAKSPVTSGEPSIGVDDSSTIQGVEIGGCPLNVKVSPAVYQRYDTYSKLMTAIDDPGAMKTLAPFLLTQSALHGAPVPDKGRLLRSDSTIYATVVESVQWADPKRVFPGATITDHTVRVPGFGKILFGELLITSLYRRLTMLRLELGSPEGGDAAFAEVETNGIWP